MSKLEYSGGGAVSLGGRGGERSTSGGCGSGGGIGIGVGVDIGVGLVIMGSGRGRICGGGGGGGPFGGVSTSMCIVFASGDCIWGCGVGGARGGDIWGCGAPNKEIRGFILAVSSALCFALLLAFSRITCGFACSSGVRRSGILRFLSDMSLLAF